jgi:two-component system response regulator HydG
MPDQTVLVVDDEADIREICSEALLDAGYAVLTAASAREARALLDSEIVDIVLTDLAMPEITGLGLLRMVKERHIDAGVILITGHATVDTAVEALKNGAYDYIAKPFTVDDLVTRVNHLAERRELATENRLLRSQIQAGRGPGGMVGTSLPMQHLYRAILKLAPRRQPVLITGESGTGKELVARAIHECSLARQWPFVALDCAALSDSLIESELFGHVPGAFTGAAQGRVGLLASAGQGTLFLDEIGELPIGVQAKLLRALQEREFRPLGSNQCQHFEARIVAATNRDLPAAIREGKFREDLYFRLDVLSIQTPPLRRHVEDIPALVRFFIDGQAGQGNPVTGISRQALRVLAACPWPGNIRELRNHLERAMAMSDGPLIQIGDLAPELRTAHPATASEAGLTQMQLAERDAIVRALASTEGHRVEAANFLGIGRTTLYKKLKDYGI